MDRRKRLAQIWQKAMIRMAVSPGITQGIEASGPARRLARRFTAGETPEAAVRTARALWIRNISASFFFLGEYVTDPEQVRTTLKALGRVLKPAAAAGLDLHLSIDPTQAGLMQSRQACQGNLEALARQVQMLRRPGRADVLMLDMEDASVTRDTLDIFFSLRDRGLPAAITLQACLRRTPEDLARAAASGAMIRLVKGAFAEGPAIAHSPGRPTDKAFVRLASVLLSPSSLAAGTFPVFATHDPEIIRTVCRLAASRGVSPRAFEFELLYGVGTALQQDLAARGYRVRVYLPFGKEFWPYSVRRIGENPKNLRFLFRALAPEGERGSPGRSIS